MNRLTPFPPDFQWRLGLDSSVGNWSFPYKSDYWIRNNQMLWCGDMPQSPIDAGRARDKRAKGAYYDYVHIVLTHAAEPIMDKTALVSGGVE